MSAFLPSISPEIASIAPGFRALSIRVEAAMLAVPELGAQQLREACRFAQAGGPAWADAHMQAWADVFRAFGAKPQRTPCSAEALRKRVLRDGSLPAIDPVVDLYNAISLRYAIPVGGENLAAYIGQPRLVLADGSELFDTVKEGLPAMESPERGEVVWRDDQGVTCRRWNWRQGVRTRLSAADRQMWFILESLPAMPLEALQQAGDALAQGIAQMMPGSAIESSLITLP
ncbi:B3/B4 domain-containing protein [Aquitalea aquatica]|uniref:B3/4 domain-containing protein n=1 Tax=Aquitalea aquatica TaxID=3044273 RepID=A0A838Y212_9NEIS|nr:B3/4 domain-containing protein [Aquitalea magnusonii]MBA4707312.1 B3/4 domain-containing protein [Aquitalea magnusonii]